MNKTYDSEFKPETKAVVPMLRDERVRRVRLVCTQCGEEDFVKLFHDESLPGPLNCAKCGAGRGLDQQAMLMRQVGMFVDQDAYHAQVAGEQTH